ncbi:MAG: hypothetical protein SF069_11660 [Phycisphaerae bacterium]|nr:hypothetical protein [Phycisphaerae bacterium]
MDRFGRVRSHSWIDSAGGVNELLGLELDFDALGNKRFARVRQLGHDNDRSYLFGYDDLQQPTFAELGRLNNENTSIVPDALVTLRRRSQQA